MLILSLTTTFFCILENICVLLLKDYRTISSSKYSIILCIWDIVIYSYFSLSERNITIQIELHFLPENNFFFPCTSNHKKKASSHTVSSCIRDPRKSISVKLSDYIGSIRKFNHFIWGNFCALRNSPDCSMSSLLHIVNVCKKSKITNINHTLIRKIFQLSNYIKTLSKNWRNPHLYSHKRNQIHHIHRNQI